MASQDENKKSLSQFYKPYLSDGDESDSDSGYTSSGGSSTASGSSNGSGSSGSSGSSNGNGGAAPTAPIVAPVPPPSVYTRGAASGPALISQVSGGDTKPDAAMGTAFRFNQTSTKFTSSKNTTTIMLNSTDRDTNSYPLPTNFTLRLPRTYRNVVSLNVTQIKLLSSFYYFSGTKNNTNLRILEFNRVKKVNGVDISNAIDVYIRDGTYDANQLINELNNQLNTAPLYNRMDINEFSAQFSATSDYTLLFNDPGDTTYNPLTGVFDILTSKSAIVGRYFKSNLTLGSAYNSPIDCATAYYYPLLKDLTVIQGLANVKVAPVPYENKISRLVINNSPTYPNLNYHLNDPLAQTYLGGSSYYDRIVYGYQGLKDPYIVLLCSDPTNKAIMDEYKSNNVWDKTLVNRYVTSYNTSSGRLTIYSNQLNTSLTTTLNNQYNTILTQQLVAENIDPSTVPVIQLNNSNNNGALAAMYNFIQGQFTNYFGVNYASYTPNFFTNLSNEIPLYDVSGRYGWSLTYTGTPQVDSSAVTYPDASGYWPSIQFDNSVWQTGLDGDLYYPTVFGGLARYTYTKPLAADTNGFLTLNGSNEETLGYQDISFNVFPTAYTKVKFKSRCRQTLYIETLPPFVNEIPVFPNLTEAYYLDTTNTPLLYSDTSEENILVDAASPDFYMYDISQNLLDGADYMRNIAPGDTVQTYLKFVRQQKPLPQPNQIPPPGILSVYTFRPHLFFQIQHASYPIPLGWNSTDTKFNSDIYIEREDSQVFGMSYEFYWYRDRAAYMADVKNLLKNSYKTNPKHYFTHRTITKDINSAVITVPFISKEMSYGLIFSTDTSFPATALRIFVIRHDPYGVYTYPNAVDYRRLPINYSYLQSKPTPVTNFPTPYPTLFNSKGFRNCYDISGVSNNILDNYILTSDFSHYDPYNFTNNTTLLQSPLRYTYQFKTPAIGPPTGVSQWSQFFFNGSSNVVYDSLLTKSYYGVSDAAKEISSGVLPFTGISNEFIFANWFRAGATTNLYNANYNPLLAPEQTISPLPVDANPFTVMSPVKYTAGYTNNQFFPYTPFALCRNSTTISTDISFNRLDGLGVPAPGQLYLGPDVLGGPSSQNITSIMGIPFTPPLGRYITPTKIVVKFGYLQPTFVQYTGTLCGRNTNIRLTNTEPFVYQSHANSPLFTGQTTTDLAQWDDKFYLNRRNLVLGVYRSNDIRGRNVSTLRLNSALCTLTLRKVCQVGQLTSVTNLSLRSTRGRTPEWGTYYVYETGPAGSLWTTYDQEFSGTNYAVNSWAGITKSADISTPFFTTSSSGEGDNLSYYTDVSNNSLCFVPFYPVLTNAEKASGLGPFTKNYSDIGAWAPGSFTGLTYTTRPYIPVKRSETLGENPYIFYKDGASYNSVCVEEIGSPGIAMGDSSTYLGAAGPLCWGTKSDGTIVTPNYRVGTGLLPSFFNCRVNIKIKDIQYNPLEDLSAFGGENQVKQCFTDTQTYLYDTTARPRSDFTDISGGWGQEKAAKFKRYDDDSGYNYLSYMRSVDISRNSVVSINVRGYVPTVKFLSGLRIVGKNWLDFGNVSLRNLMNEIDALVNAGVSILPDGRLSNDAWRIANYYTHDYTRILLHFNKVFNGTFVFGKGAINPDYPGLSISATGFSDFLLQYIAFTDFTNKYGLGLATAQLNTISAMQQYIVNKYTGVLPSTVLTRNNFTSPLLFSIQFKSALVSPYLDIADQWGFGWNLGFPKLDTDMLTRHVAATFIRIIDDYIFMKLNDELNMNTIDVSNKENLTLNRDTFGESNKYYGKLLLNSFGSFAQTFIQNTKTFISPVGKLDRLTFKFYDTNNQLLTNSDCDFNIVVEIGESIDVVDTASILVKGTGEGAGPPPPVPAAGAGAGAGAGDGDGDGDGKGDGKGKGKGNRKGKAPVKKIY